MTISPRETPIPPEAPVTAPQTPLPPGHGRKTPGTGARLSDIVAAIAVLGPFVLFPLVMQMSPVSTGIYFFGLALTVLALKTGAGWLESKKVVWDKERNFQKEWAGEKFTSSYLEDQNAGVVSHVVDVLAWLAVLLPFVLFLVYWMELPLPHFNVSMGKGTLLLCLDLLWKGVKLTLIFLGVIAFLAGLLNLINLSKELEDFKEFTRREFMEFREFIITREQPLPALSRKFSPLSPHLARSYSPWSGRLFGFFEIPFEGGSAVIVLPRLPFLDDVTEHLLYRLNRRGIYGSLLLFGASEILESRKITRLVMSTIIFEIMDSEAVAELFLLARRLDASIVFCSSGSERPGEIPYALKEHFEYLHRLDWRIGSIDEIMREFEENGARLKAD